MLKPGTDGRLARISAIAGPAAPPRAATRSQLALLALVLAVAAALRIGFASQRSLVLDELHTLYHAAAPDAEAFLADLRRDNHPPLAFLVVSAARQTLGDSALALRAPAILFGLLTVALVWRIGRRLPGRQGAAVAAALLAVSSLHLDVSAQARMYALLALAVTGLLEALLRFLETPSEVEPRGAGLALVFWAAVGLHTHYYFVHYFVLSALAVALSAALTPHVRAQARRAIPYALAALVLFAPWAWLGLRHQLGHGEPPGGREVDLRRIGEALVHLLFVNVRVAGPELRALFVGSGLLAVAWAAYGAVRLARAELQTSRFAAPVVLAFLGLGAPLWAGLVALALPRAGFNWQYLVPSASAFVLLVGATEGAGRRQRLRHCGLAVVGASALGLASVYATTRGTEDYRGAVRWIAHEARAHDAVVAVEWQPRVFDQGLAWRYYAPRVAPPGAQLPALLEIDAWYSLADPEALERYEQVFLLRRSLPADAPLVERLRAELEEVALDAWGYGLWVHRFRRAAR